MPTAENCHVEGEHPLKTSSQAATAAAIAVIFVDFDRMNYRGTDEEGQAVGHQVLDEEG
jgi:hypothetical protein